MVVWCLSGSQRASERNLGGECGETPSSFCRAQFDAFLFRWMVITKASSAFKKKYRTHSTASANPPMSAREGGNGVPPDLRR
jgi:hypothetical protein